MGCHQNRLDAPLKIFYFIFIFDIPLCASLWSLKLYLRPLFSTSTVIPGPLRSVPAPPLQHSHFQNQTKTRVMGHHRNPPNKKFGYFFVFLGLTSHPRTPLKGPSGLPKKSYLDMSYIKPAAQFCQNCLDSPTNNFEF